MVIIMTYFCHECGSPLDETAKFCPGCGARVQAVSHGLLLLEPVNYEFHRLSWWLGGSGGTNVRITLQGHTMTIWQQLRVLVFIKGKEKIQNIDVNQIACLQYEKTLNKGIILFILVIAGIVLAVGTGPMHASWLGIIFLFGLHEKSVYIQMKNGYREELKNLSSDKGVEELFQSLQQINPGIRRTY